MSGLDVALYAGFIRGDFAPSEVQFRYRMKKMGAQILKPKTRTVLVEYADLIDEIDKIDKIDRRRTKNFQPLPDREFINFTELLQSVPMAQKTIKQLISQHEFPDSAKGKNPRYWKTEEVKNWLDTHGIH